MNALAVADVPRGTDPLAGAILQVFLDEIDIGPNVRVNVEGIDELAASIVEHGVLQPIKLRAVGDRWVVVWGQRRLLAARKAGLERIPAIVGDQDKAPAELSIEQLVENLHRADLPALDRARAMRIVVDAGTSQADLARELGLHPSTIANDLGLLESPAAIQKSIESGQLSPAHAKALKGLAPKTQVAVAKDAIERGYSAHRLEEEVQRQKRQAEEEAKREQAGAAQRRENRVALEAAIAELAAKPKPGLGIEIVVFADYYGRSDTKTSDLAELLKKAGFTKVRIASGSGNPDARPSGGVCNCTAWKAALRSTYSYKSNGYVTKLQATPACIVAAHRQAKATADRKAESDKYSLQEKVVQHVKRLEGAWALPDARAIAIDRLLAETVLWGLLSYRLPDWSVAHGGKRNTAWQVIHALPDADLAKELAMAIAGDFRDKAGYHVDWTGLAAELGVEAG